ncbi:MAG: Gfo/Idh/MocA family protein, partial [Salinibacter sp.]
YYQGTWKGTQALDGGGALMNQSIHAVDAIAWLAGTSMGLNAHETPVTEVHAYTDVRAHNPANVEVEDTAVAALQYRDGTLGHILGTTAAYLGTRRRLRVAGRDGTIEVAGDELVHWQFREEQPEDEEIRASFGDDEEGGTSDPMAIDYEKHTRNIKAFLDWVDRDAEYLLTGQEARQAVAIIEAIYDSAKTGRPVQLR